MKQPEQIMFFDWETYYNQQYSLSKMSTLDYICDKRFQPICVAAKVNGNQTQSLIGDETSAPARMREFLMDLGWEKSLVIAHHNRFDSGITRFRFGMPSPAMYGCTRLMARAVVRPYVPRVDLKSVANYYRRGEKGAQREAYINYRLEDFSEAQLVDYVTYCEKDTDLCAAIFADMLPEVPMLEQVNIDIVLRMYLHPRFLLDEKILTEHLDALEKDRINTLRNLPLGLTEADLQSAPKFAAALDELGAEVPMKWSEKQAKEVPAFAKTDVGMQELMDHPDPRVQFIVAARLKVKSTNDITRAARLKDIARRYHFLAVPIIYGGAHTLRYSGDEKINLQNVKRGSRIRYAMKGPNGYEVTAADYSQIEARILAALANCDKLLAAFRDAKRDPYCEFATDVYGRPITKADEAERFVGKTCILGLGYQVGGKKLQRTLAIAGQHFTIKQCTDMVYLYRRKYHEIPSFWNLLENAIRAMVQKDSFDLPGGCEVLAGMLKLPNGFFMPYHNLRFDSGGQSIYTFGKEVRTLYGGKYAENITQALAALLIREAMSRMHLRGVTPALQVHDDMSVVHKKKDRAKVREIMEEEMLRQPWWLPNLPLEIEMKTGESYGDAK